jgi:hypothetical protein
MEIAQNTEDFITAKRKYKNAILNFANCCILKVCFQGNSLGETEVYQLKNIRTKKKTG